MSQHLGEEALWEAAKTPPVGDDYAHLQLCQECREQLESIKFAQSMLVEPPPPPLLSEQSARRIGTVLRKAAETEARRAQWWGSWWPFNWSPTWALAPLAAVMLAFVAYRMTSVVPADDGGGPGPIAKRDDVAPEVSPTPPPMPEAPRPLPVKKVVASVKRTKGAKSGSVALKKSQELKEGSTVATAKGGELLMALPDGSQIGLASASQVQLAKLEDKAVTLDIAKGSMKVTALHDPTRELRVRAGDLEVYDVGTEFIVTRDEGRTLVAVEEGEVEVKTAAGESVPLKAGQAVEYKNGKLERQQWATAEELPKPRPPALAARPKQTPSPLAHKPSAEETPEIPSEPQKATPPAAPVQDPEQPTAKAPEVATNEPAAHDEWATPENLKDAPVHTPPPTPPAEPPPSAQAPTALPQPPPPPEQQGPAPATEDEANVSFLAKLQKQAMKVKDAFTPRPRLARASDIATLTDQKKCAEALQLADAWLTEPVPKGESFNLRRSVLQSKLRCLNFLGRTGDAAAVQRELDRL